MFVFSNARFIHAWELATKLVVATLSMCVCHLNERNTVTANDATQGNVLRFYYRFSWSLHKTHLSEFNEMYAFRKSIFFTGSRRQIVDLFFYLNVSFSLRPANMKQKNHVHQPCKWGWRVFMLKQPKCFICDTSNNEATYVAQLAMFAVDLHVYTTRIYVAYDIG